MTHLTNAVLIRQFTQYVLVGGIAFVVDFSMLYGLTHYAALHYLVSATAGFLVGLLVSYLLCIGWIFHFRAIESAPNEFAIFAGVGIVGLLLNNGIIFALTEWAQLHYLLSKIIAAALILAFNFSLRRALLFTDRQPTSRQADKTSSSIIRNDPQ